MCGFYPAFCASCLCSPAGRCLPQQGPDAGTWGGGFGRLTFGLCASDVDGSRNTRGLESLETLAQHASQCCLFQQKCQRLMCRGGQSMFQPNRTGRTLQLLVKHDWRWRLLLLPAPVTMAPKFQFQVPVPGSSSRFLSPPKTHRQPHRREASHQHSLVSTSSSSACLPVLFFSDTLFSILPLTSLASFSVSLPTTFPNWKPLCNPARARHSSFCLSCICRLGGQGLVGLQGAWQ
jgi:hypothetical protein